MNLVTDEQRAIAEQRDLCWRSIVKMVAAAGPAYTPRWVLDLMDDDGKLPDIPWPVPVKPNLTDEQQRLIRLGQAVERLHERSHDGFVHYPTVTYDAIYAEAEWIAR